MILPGTAVPKQPGDVTRPNYNNVIKGVSHKADSALRGRGQVEWHAINCAGNVVLTVYHDSGRVASSIILTPEQIAIINQFTED